MPLIDLLQLLAKGLLLASLPIAFVWISYGSHRAPQRLRRLAWLTVFFTFDLIVFGAFTRLTDSGLGCPDWPGCYAKANPFAAASHIRAAEIALPSGPVTMSKAWIEMIHRYLAMAIGVLIIVMLILAWREYARTRQDKPWLITLILGLVSLQGAFGAWTVTLKLQPMIVTTHLLLGMLLLALLTWHAVNLQAKNQAIALPLVSRQLMRLRLLGFAAAVVLFAQIALGGWVSSNYAVLACEEFPLCQGQWIPAAMDFNQGFDWLRELGKTTEGSYLPFAALTAIHWTHRSFAWLVLVIMAILAWQAWRIQELRGLTRNLALLLLAQFMTGIINVLWDWPLLAAVLHNAGAAALVLIMTLFNQRVWRGLTLPSSHAANS